jgi:hypothetical protein
MRDGEIGEEAGHAGVEDGDVFPACLVAERTGEPTFAQARRTNVILPGVRRLKSGSRIGFIRVWVILSRWSASGGMQAPITSLCGSPIAPWRCCRPG